MSNLYLACYELGKKVITGCLLFAFVLQSCSIDGTSNTQMKFNDGTGVASSGEVLGSGDNEMVSGDNFRLLSVDVIDDKAFEKNPRSGFGKNLLKAVGIFVVGRAIEFLLIEGYKSFENSSYLISDTSNGREMGHGRLLQTGNTCSCAALSACTTNLLSSTTSLSAMTSSYNNCTSRLTNATNSFNTVNNTLTQTTAWLTGNVSALAACQSSLTTCGSNLSGNQTLLTSCNNYLAGNNSLLTSCNGYLTGNNSLISTCDSSLSTYTTNYNNCNTALNGDGTWSHPGYYGLVNGYTIAGQSVAGYIANYTACDTALNGGGGCAASLANCNNLYANQIIAFNNLTASFASQETQLDSCQLSLINANANVESGVACNKALYGYQLTPHNAYSYIPGCYDFIYGNTSAGITGTEALYGQLSGSTYTRGCLDTLNGYYFSPNEYYGCESILNGNISTAGGLPGITGYISQWSTLMLDLYGDGTITNPGVKNIYYGNSTLVASSTNNTVVDLPSAATQISDLQGLLYGDTVNGVYYPGYMGQLYGYTDINSAYLPGCADLLNGNSVQSIPTYLGALTNMCQYYPLNSTSTPYCTTSFGGACTTCTNTCSTTSGVTTCTACTGCTVSIVSGMDTNSNARTIVSSASGSTCSNCTLASGSSVSGSCDTCASYLL